MERSGKDIIEDAVRTKQYSHEALTKCAKEADNAIVHLVHILNQYQNYVREAYKPSEEKLQETAARALKLCVTIAEDLMLPLLANELQTAHIRQNNLRNERIVAWNKLLVKGIFASIGTMFMVTFFLQRGILIGLVAGIVVIFSWIWIGRWRMGIDGDANKVKRSKSAKSANSSDSDSEEFDDLDYDLDDEELAQGLRPMKGTLPDDFGDRDNFDPNHIEADIEALRFSTRNSTRDHVKYLSRLNLMNRAVDYVAKSQPIPDDILDSLKNATPLLEIYKQSAAKRKKKDD